MSEKLNNNVAIITNNGIGSAGVGKTESKEREKKIIGQKTIDTKYGTRFVQSFPINLPIEKIDLHKWATEMTDADYRSYSKDHKMMSSIVKDGIFYMKNLENIGTDKLIQRYELKYHSPQHIQFYSSHSTAYVMRLFPVKVSVAWEMQLTRTSDTTCQLTCLIGVDFPNIFLRTASWLSSLGGLFLKRHLSEEGNNFAKDIKRKFSSAKEILNQSLKEETIMTKKSTFTYKGSTALITGATGGLGEVFAEQLAEKGSNLVLVGRSEDKLQALAERLEGQHKITATVLTADLASSAEVEQIVSNLKAKRIDVDLLINNAGFGVFQRFLETPLERQIEELDVNVRAVIQLTHGLAPAMVKRNKGGVINLSSSAGFQPLAGANVYAAAKSFVLFFSEALAQELTATDVRVLAVCPGPIATGFFADKNPDIRRNQMDDPKAIVTEVLRAFDRGQRVLVPGKFSVWMGSLLPRLFPRTLVAQFGESVVRKLNHV